MRIKRLFISLLIIFGLIISAIIAWRHITFRDMEGYQEFFGAPEYESVDIHKPLNQQTAIVEINGRTFAIPKVYIQDNLGGKRNQDDGLNLLYVMPGFTSRLDFKNKEEYDKAFHDSRMAHMLIRSSKEVISPQQMIKNLRKYGDIEHYAGKYYKLKLYTDENNPGHPNLRFDDTYLELDKKGNIISFIGCRPEGKVSYPGCNHEFEDNGIRYNIYYNKANYLANWQEHRRNAIAFINQFEIHKNKIGE